MRSDPVLGAWVRRQLLKRLTLLVGIFCALSQVSGALHWVLVEHARCAEHGDWVHADESDHAHAEAPAAADSPAAPAPVSVQAADGDEHGHDHCDFLRTPRELALGPSARAAFAAPTVVGPSGEVHRSDSKAPIAGYELAPKTSPPASAS